MIRVLFDTNIILDIAIERKPFVVNSLKAVNLIDVKIIGFINILTLVNTFYYARKKVGIEQAKEFIRDLLTQFEVLNETKEICIKALNSNFRDFEDAVQNFSAIDEGIEIIVTRNIKDFKNSKIQIFTPEQLIKFIEKE